MSTLTVQNVESGYGEVQILWGASFSYEKLQVVGGAALALAGELLGITSIQTECFS
jgi:ABC-type branched-subunit amino acid transport system ATPase component